MTQIRPLIAGNWKMNGLTASLAEASTLAQALAAQPASARVALCPPATLITQMSRLLDESAILVGGQDCHAEPKGAFTGDISAEMLADAGATMVILGHSERRALCGESDDTVRAKALAALRGALEPIVCIGETLTDRESGRTLEVVSAQVRGSLPDALAGVAFAVAYEPVWAIGTGLTPTLEQIEEVHVAIRGLLVERFGTTGEGTPILYGGSVNAKNAADILKVAEVGGALVGGASLKCDDYIQIVRAA
jgi:triosephosphate isomerase